MFGVKVLGFVSCECGINEFEDVFVYLVFNIEVIY